MKRFTMKIDGIRLQTCNARRETTKPEEFAEAFRFAMWANRSSQFWLGDMLLAGLDLFGDDFYQYVDADPAAFDHLERCRAISAKVPPENRNMSLSWTHHAFAASIPVYCQVAALAHAEEAGLNSREFQAWIAERRREGAWG